MVSASLVVNSALDVAHGIAQGFQCWPHHLVATLAEAVGAETVGYARWNQSTPWKTQSENVGGPPLSDSERAAWESHMLDYPFFANLLLHGSVAATRTTDLTSSMLRFRSTAVYDELLAPRQARYQANFALLDEDDEVAIVGLYRRERDFTPGEVDILEQTRSLLAAAVQYRHRVDAASVALGRTRLARAVTLTAREEEVLTLVATGATNERVARKLTISPRTVRKHLESIFHKLSVPSRAAAVAAWKTPGSNLRDVASCCAPPRLPQEPDVNVPARGAAPARAPR